MPWNEPGGDDKDPWSKGKSNDQGGRRSGDNIEDITRKMNDKIGGFLGGRKAGGSGDGPSAAVMGLVAVALFLAWLASGIYTVDPAERGVEFRFGAYLETNTAGLNWHYPWPIGSKEIVDIDKIRKAEDATQMLTSDENIVNIGIAAQYKIKNPEDYLFNVFLPDYEVQQSIGTLFQVMRSAVREVVGGNTMDSILIENRQSIAPNTQKVMQKILDNYKSGLEVVEVNLETAEAPKAVKDAFADVVRAREDEAKFKNDAETYSNRVVPLAEGNASRLREEAVAYQSRIVSRAEGDASRFRQLVEEYEKAPAVTRNRLYLETMEDVYENTTKIMVDSKSGNNLLYLPLNQLQGNARQGSNEFDPASTAFVEQAIRKRQNQGSIRSGVRNGTRSSRQ